VTLNEAELKQLMLAGLEGDSAAYRTLLDRLSKLLRNYYRAKLSRIGREATEAEDVMQDVLMALHTRRHTYDPNELFMPWVYAIARYKLIDHLRRMRSSLADVPLDDAGELAAQEEHAGVESGHDLNILMRELPDKMRQAIQSVKLDGLSVTEAARRCGMSESAVKVNVHRGLKLLAAFIARERKT
jgi:RNA polymerase sigma-70 factor (ECF subfamily)